MSVECPPQSFADQVFEVLREDPERLAQIIKDHFTLQVSCSYGDDYDSRKVKVELYGNFQNSWDKPLLSSYDTIPT
jgi:hypothetical protein